MPEIQNTRVTPRKRLSRIPQLVVRKHAGNPKHQGDAILERLLATRHALGQGPCNNENFGEVNYLGGPFFVRGKGLILCHGQMGGGPIAFAGFGATESKGIGFGSFCHNIVTLWSWTEGASLRGGPIAFGTFCMIPISYGIPSLGPWYASIDDCSNVPTMYYLKMKVHTPNFTQTEKKEVMAKMRGL